jgi:hypothetical protein
METADRTFITMVLDAALPRGVIPLVGVDRYSLHGSFLKHARVGQLIALGNVGQHCCSFEPFAVGADAAFMSLNSWPGLRLGQAG